MHELYPVFEARKVLHFGFDAVSLRDMTGKTIGIGVVVIIIVALGAYIIFKNPFGAAPAQQPAAATTTAAQDQATTTVQAQDVTVGTGAQATPGAVVSVLYVGKLSDGTVFDSSAAHGNKPLSFTLGQQGLIPGFQIGVNGMKVGGERLMAVPPGLGYGTQAVTDASGTVIIPANSTLIFDVKLVDVKAGTTAPATNAPAKTQ
jgi:FKBP-type peptidyl-prolyl cis-trans isomerase FkpA